MEYRERDVKGNAAGTLADGVLTDRITHIAQKTAAHRQIYGAAVVEPETATHMAATRLPR